MAAIELDGNTLGEKHRSYNKLVKDALKDNKIVRAEDFNPNDYDVINLINIDVASCNKNVEYILRVLICDDMLYVSRAIKLSDWLINDDNYGHIINPNFLRLNLYPKMCSKAVIKLMKHIRLNLKDVKRAQEFYEHEEDPAEAAKWLPNCSLDFVCKNIKSHLPHMKISLLRRLCEKSIQILEIYFKNEENTNYYQKRIVFQNTMFLLSSDTNKYLDILEQSKPFQYPTFNKRTTTIVLKNCFDRITGKFEDYYKCIHLPTFLKYLKKENVKKFLLDQSKFMKQNKRTNIFNDAKRLQLFINFMPFEERFECVKQVFIDKIHESTEPCLLRDEEKIAMNIFYKCIGNDRIPEHFWYQFAPFEIALPKIKDSFSAASSSALKKSMLMVLITSAHKNTDNLVTILKYFQNKINNMDASIKTEVIKQIISEINLENCDEHSWSTLDATFKDIGIYSESQKSEENIIETVIIYKALRKEKVSETVEKKFIFNSLLAYHKNLTETAKESLFIYLFDFIMTKLGSCVITTEDEFKTKINLLEKGLQLLKDFRKEVSNYPILINTIKQFSKIRSDNKWDTNLSSLYNFKKEWRKLLFRESLVLYPTESTLINALKHDSRLLDDYKTEVSNIFANNELTLTSVLSKIKIYWANSLAKHITTLYKETLNDIGKHKVATRGLIMLMSRNHLQKLFEKYAPKEAKIDWSNVDEVTLGLQKHFAKNMHVARPQPIPDTILWYCKGDYLQYALPSLLSIFYNLNVTSTRNYMNNLLDAPASLQKHGIRIAVTKIQLDELLPLLNNVWMNNKNATVRSVMFKGIFEILCKQKDFRKIKTAWDLIEIFIDNLTLQEDASIYKLLFEVEKVPLTVRSQFYIKSYNLLKKLVENGDEELKNKFYTFTKYSVEIMDLICPEFIQGIVNDFLENTFTKQKANDWQQKCIVAVISSFSLCAKNEQTQLERYEKVLQPIVKRCLILWNETENNEYFVRTNLVQILNNLRTDVDQHVVKKKMIIPCKLFIHIQKQLEESLSVPENYMLLTKWQLTAGFVSALDKHQPILDWDEACAAAVEEFGNKCRTDLKEHCNKYCPRIYLLFIKALRSMLHEFIPENVHVNIFGSFLHDDYVQGHLATLNLLSRQKERGEIEGKYEELRKIISKHRSHEVKMHYFNTFGVK